MRPIRVDFRSRSAESAIVFIHGFGGRAEETWGAFPRLLAENRELDEWDIFGVGYSSRLRLDAAFWAGDAGLSALGYYLRTILTVPPLNRYGKIALVAHSMGGLIAQQALLDADTSSRVSHLFLFGSPNSGVQKANFFSGLKRQVRDMRAGGEFITTLRADWSAAYPDETPFKIRVIAGERDAFIPEDSVFAPFPDAARFVVPGDHVTMVKPDRSDSVAVQLVTRDLIGPAKRNNLPAQLTSFVGRINDVVEIKNLLATTRMLTLVGTGGVGKTRLALRVGTDLLGEFDDGVWFVDLAPLGQGDLIASTVAGIFGIGNPGQIQIEELAHVLKAKDTLMILDNCEHLIAEVAHMAGALLRGCPRLRIIATSRQGLNIEGENLIRVSSLEVPEENETLNAEDGVRYSAVALFAERAVAADKAFRLTDDNVVRIAEICRHLDGLALAIELAAARIGMLTPDQLLQMLSERFRLLSGGKRTVLPRQQTMHALIDWSHDLLDDDERMLFRRLAIFVGDFSLEAVQAICSYGDMDEWRVLEVLSSLVDKSLVATEARGAVRRYRFFESTRAYALEKVSAAGELRMLQGRHVEYFAGLASRAKAEALDLDLSNIRAALDWSLTCDEYVETGIRLLTSLADYSQLRGLSAEMARRAQHALALKSSLPEVLQAALWLMLARARYWMFETRLSVEAANQACAIYERLGDRSGLARALRVRSTKVDRAESARAERDLREALAIFREVGDRKEIAQTLHSIGVFLRLQDRLAEGAETIREALAMFQTLGDEHRMCFERLNLAEIEFALCDASKAIALSRENLETEFIKRDSTLRAQQEANLAAYLYAVDRPQESHAAAIRALRIARDTGLQVIAAEALQHVAALLAQTDVKNALRLLGFVDGVFSNAGFSREFTERYTRDRIMSSVALCANEEEIAASLSQGATMSEDEADAYVTTHVPSEHLLA
jgi:predicted ATPase/pimeloyl-ACP methyl ester carboxylesterase